MKSPRRSASLRTGESRIIGVLAANLGNPVMAAIVAAIERSLRYCGFIMVLCETLESADQQDGHLRELDAQLARAIIMVMAVPSRRLDEASAHGFSQPAIIDASLAHTTALQRIDGFSRRARKVACRA